MYCTLSVLTHKHSSPTPPSGDLKPYFKCFCTQGTAAGRKPRSSNVAGAHAGMLHTLCGKFARMVNFLPTGTRLPYTTPGNAVVSDGTELHPATIVLFVLPSLQNVGLPVKHRCGCFMSGVFSARAIKRNEVSVCEQKSESSRDQHNPPDNAPALK